MKLVFLHVFLVIIGVQLVRGDDNADMAMRMLKKYQYMGENHPNPAMQGDEMFEEALKNFQNFAGMNETGELDNATMAKLMSPRCGLPDIEDKGSLMRRRRKRYAIYGTRWVGVISYNFKSYSKRSDLTPATIRFQVKKAFDEWKRYSLLQYELSRTTGSISISFERRDHGDGQPLDGPGMTLAHAFYPSNNPIGGDIHFDDDERWTVGGKAGTDFYFVTLHELGHSLGLEHSEVTDAVMYPYYPGYISGLSLHSDDIKGIQRIYGSRSRPTTSPSPPSSTESTDLWRRQFCSRGTVDAIASLNDAVIVFQGDMYAIVGKSGINPGYPRQIRDDWSHLPADLDAALVLEDHAILLLFKDKKYWRYTWDRMDEKPELVAGYPRLIHSDFISGLPSTVSAAYTWSDNGRIYIIQDKSYNRIRNNIVVSSSKITMRCDRWYYSYPKDFESNWNVEADVSDALMYHGRTFFFSGDEYYRYNDNKYKPDAGYPKKTATCWFGCPLSGSHDNLAEMEMDMMQRESQFSEIQTIIEHETGSNCCGHNQLFASSVLFIVLIAITRTI